MAVDTPHTAPFPVSAVLTGITLAYRNTNLIADNVLPRVPVGAREFKYWTYSREDRFTVPETLVGRKGMPNEVEFGATEEAGKVQDYGLDDVIPNDDISQAPAGYDPKGHAVEAMTDLILLDREVRAANLLFNPNSYVASNVVTLSGSSQWSDASSDPLKALLSALDTPMMRPNVLVLGQAAWTILRQHPALVSAALANSGTKGTVTREQLASLLEVEEVVIGQGYFNTAKPGQPAQMTRVWGKHAALIYRNKLANSQRGATFGFTAQWGNRVAAEWAEPKWGLRGAVRVRAGESVRELVIAPDLGMLFQNVVA
jgi:hypothetical protein